MWLIRPFVTYLLLFLLPSPEHTDVIRSQLGSTGELSTKEEDLRDCFLILPIATKWRRAAVPPTRVTSAISWPG